MRVLTLLLLPIVLVVTGCRYRNVESSAERDQRELQARLNSKVGGAALKNVWCTFIDSDSKFNFHGFLRLTFNKNDQLRIEQWAEVEGEPWGNLDEDKTGIWRLDRDKLNLKLDKDRDVLFSVVLGELKGIQTMTLTNVADPKETSLMWTCNKSVTDPIPITIKKSVEPEPPIEPGEDPGTNPEPQEPQLPDCDENGHGVDC